MVLDQHFGRSSPARARKPRGNCDWESCVHNACLRGSRDKCRRLRHTNQPQGTGQRDVRMGCPEMHQGTGQCASAQARDTHRSLAQAAWHMDEHRPVHTAQLPPSGSANNHCVRGANLYVHRRMRLNACPCREGGSSATLARLQPLHKHSQAECDTTAPPLYTWAYEESPPPSLKGCS